MKTPLERIRIGAVLLVAVFVVAVVSYRSLGNYDWVDAVWMVVITISSVGFSEQSEASTTVQLVTIGVILIGMSAAAYTFGGFMQLMLEGEFERLLGRRRMSREIEQLDKHVIICGFGRIGQVLARDLQGKGRPFVIVDNNPPQIDAASSRQFLCLQGDATEERTLIQAGLDRAASLFTGLPSDASNVFITLTARNLNRDVQIIARAEKPSTEKKLRQAGADRVVMPTLIGAHHVERMITRPTTADLMELVAESSFPELDLDEISVEEGSDLVGVTVEKTQAHRRHRLLVVAVKQADGKMIFSPDASHAFHPGDTLMLMGHREDILRLRANYGV